MSRDLNHHRNRHARPEFPTPTACQPPQTPRSDRWTPDFAGALTLSLGYDMTQPPLGGIVTDLPGNRGQAMGLNVFTLFTGLGLGSLLFQAALTWGFPFAFTTFGAAALIAAAVAIPLFRSERPHTAGTPA